jgi:hypothetical protein
MVLLFLLTHHLNHLSSFPGALYSFVRGPAVFRRGKPRFQPSGQAFLIVTEGEKTEPNYFLALRKLLQLAAADVEILHPLGTDPLTLTREAIRIRDDRKSQAKKGFAIPYDEVWVVFDLEKPHDGRHKLAANAMGLPEAAGIEFAYSNPCFEFWLLLHKQFTTAPFAGCDQVVKRLEVHWKNYFKGLSPTVEFLRRIPNAVVNAERCRKHHETSGGDGNPSTMVDTLVRHLNSATRSHLQLALD